MVTLIETATDRHNVQCMVMETCANSTVLHYRECLSRTLHIYARGPLYSSYFFTQAAACVTGENVATCACDAQVMIRISNLLVVIVTLIVGMRRSTVFEF